MGIQPIDVRMMMPKTQEVSQVKHAENQKTPNEQFIFQQHMDKEVKENSEKVLDPNEANKEEKFDAREEGKNKFSENQSKKKKKKQELADPDSATIDDKGHFDFKI